LTEQQNEGYGYLLVHFVEDQVGHAEKIYLSLSVGDDPLRWRRLGDGPVLESVEGTTGVRDPHLVRGPDRFFLLATDLRVWRPEGPDWHTYRHRGSRDLVVWESTDLLDWSEPRFLTVAPEGAGMAWAPEALYDPFSGEYVIHFSSGLADDGDPATGRTGPSRIMTARTRDFRTVTPAQTYLQMPTGVIDMTVLVTPTAVHRFAKQDDGAPDTLQVFHQRGSSLHADDFVTLATRIGQQLGPHVEGPLAFADHHEARWYLWVDQYGAMPQGYHAFTTTDLDSGDWQHVPGLELPESTKHGVVLPLTRAEHARVDARYPALVPQ
jgi:hypothetical protein